MSKKLILSCVMGVLMMLGPIMINKAEAVNTRSDDTSNENGRTAPSSLTGSNDDKSEILTLNFLRDTGLSLQQIKQQAINIFLEVTRKDVQPGDDTTLNYPKSISKKELLKTECYLQPRAEWLYYYVGTMEPIIHLFATDVSDTKAGITKVFVPKAVKSKMTPLWRAWSEDIQKLNEHLSAIYKLVNDDKPDNVVIGEHAVAMYHIGNSLERIRMKTAETISKLEKRGIQSENVGIQ